MLIKSILVIYIIFSLNGADALEFHEDIQVLGGGKLKCRTDTQVAKDWVDASGIQTYSRALSLDIEKETAGFKSNYSIII
jgi:hypothetical protein